jgi:dihydroflavonol-4-reductase
MKIAVTGATGFIGSHLVEALIARGHEVTCLARDPRKLGWIESLSARIVYGDVCKPHTLPDFVCGQEVVVHAAALTKAVDLNSYKRVNVTGTENLLAAIKAHAPRLRRFVLVSSQEAMGPSPDGEPLGEDARPNPLSMYGISKSLAEKALRGFWDTIPMTVIRPPSVYGPRDRDILAYFRIAARGIMPIVGDGTILSIAYVKNLVAGISLSIERPLGGFRSYYFTDGAPLTWGDISLLICQALGRRAIKIAVPPFVVRMAGEISGLYSALTHRALLLSRDKIEAMKHRYWLVSDQRARSELGYRPPYSTEQGIIETARWYRSAGWL